MASTLRTENHFTGQQNLTAGTLRKPDQDLNLILVDAVTDTGAILDMIRALADKLDLDATVTDTDYRAVIDAIKADASSVTIIP